MSGSKKEVYKKILFKSIGDGDPLIIRWAYLFSYSNTNKEKPFI